MTNSNSVVVGLGTHTFTWTAWGALASEGGLWPNDTVSYGYNDSLLRQTLTLLQPNGPALTQSYGYDSDWRLTNIVSSLAGAFSYFYPGANREVQQLNLPNTSYITNTYDNLGRLQATVLKNSTNAVLDSEAYQYNSAHNRTQQTFAAGNYVSYGYDALGELLSAQGKESGGSSRWQEQFTYGYDPAGNLTARTNNALVEAFTFSNNNQITTAARTTTMTVAGQVQGTPTGVTVTANGDGGQAATVYGDGSFARAGVTLNDGANTFTAVATDNKGRQATNTVTAWLPASSTFTYDANGNLTGDGQRSFEYDDANQLTAVQVANAWRSEFAYDGLGRRRVRTEKVWNGSGWTISQVVRYLYDGMVVIRERDGNNVPQITYTRGLDLSGRLQRAGGIGGLLARTDHQEAFVNPQLATTFYHSDGGGNVMMLVDGYQHVAAQYHYDPFGNLIGESGPLADANVYRFSSKEFAVNAGLYYYGFRFYDPSLQRWLNRDPIGERGEINLYRFVTNDPINKLDPLGLYNPITGPNGPVGPGSGLADPSLYLPQFPTAPGSPTGNGGNSGYQLMSQTLAGLGLGQTAAEFGSGSASIGNNLRFYPRGFYGNQYVETMQISECAHAAGPWLFAASVIADANAARNGEIGWDKFGVNAGFGALGLTGPQGAVVAVWYSTIDNFYPGGMEGYMTWQGSILQSNMQTSPIFWSLSYPIIGP